MTCGGVDRRGRVQVTECAGNGQSGAICIPTICVRRLLRQTRGFEPSNNLLPAITYSIRQLVSNGTMLYLVGLGLGDAKDISVKGLEIVKKVGKVYLENYTSILCCGQRELEEFYGRQVVVTDREMMEEGCDEILDGAAEEAGAAVLVVGDPLNATTHTDLLLRAAGRKIPYQIIHNASILNAVACCGLQIYNFGETVSIPFWTDTWKPESYFDKILRNRQNGNHTLCLLDIKVKEPNMEALMRGINKVDSPRFMSVNTAANQLIETIRRRNNPEAGDELTRGKAPESKQRQPQQSDLTETSLCIGLARVGSDTQKIVKSNLLEATRLDLGPPLHSLVIPGTLHPLEMEMVDLFSTS